MRPLLLILALLLIVTPLAGCSCGASDTVVGVRNPFAAISQPRLVPTGYGVVQQAQPMQMVAVPAPAPAPAMQYVAVPAAAPCAPAQQPYTPGFGWAPAPTPGAAPGCGN